MSIMGNIIPLHIWLACAIGGQCLLQQSRDESLQYLVVLLLSTSATRVVPAGTKAGTRRTSVQLASAATSRKLARSSRDVVRTVLSRLKIAESPSQLSWLHVNEVRADETNTDQDTSPEQMNFLNDQLEKCLTRVFPFFDAKARAMPAADQDQNPSGPQLELLLHPPVYTCDQAARMCPKPIMNDGETLAMKNLFLRDKKKRFYLVSACVDTEIKLKEVKFAKQVGFASAESLKEKLNLVAGSVTPFGLLNDGNREATGDDKTEHSVEFHLDPRVVVSLDTTVVDFHPNACHATICMRAKDFVEFIEKETGHQVNVLDLE